LIKFLGRVLLAFRSLSVVLAGLDRLGLCTDGNVPCPPGEIFLADAIGAVVIFVERRFSIDWAASQNEVPMLLRCFR
jgi:hypothetical protein